MKRLSIPALVIALLVSACGSSQATAPTIDPVDMQSTAVASALTLLAETQAALPTSTPPPPTVAFTDTPAFTATIPPLPTLGGATFTPIPVTDSNVGDPCVTTPMPNSLPGKTIKIRIDNPTQGTINLSVNLHPGNPQGVCGYRGYTLAAGESLVIPDLVEGCYTLWAWNPDPDDYFIVTNGTSCLDDSDNWTFDITLNGIKLK